MKKHNLNTIQDIANMITRENKENFIIDFSNWLDKMINLKELTQDGAKLFKANGPCEIQIAGFVWIDDSKHKATFKVHLKKEE